MTPQEDNPYASPQPPRRTRSRTTLPGVQFSDHNDGVDWPEGDHAGWPPMDLRYLVVLGGGVTVSYLVLADVTGPWPGVAGGLLGIVSSFPLNLRE